MKRLFHFFMLFIAALLFFSCEKKPVEANFEDVEKYTIYDYLMNNAEEYSSFIAILEAGGMDKTLSAYNPNGEGYTLFLPDNEAVARFVNASPLFSSLDELLANKAYAKSISKYHILNMSIESNNFPYGAFPEPTLSGDYLTVNVELGQDTAFYKINNMAPVIGLNTELSNGFIHVINEMLQPVTETTYGWLEQHEAYSIFRAAVDLTGLKDTLDVNTREEAFKSSNYTLFLEPDSVFNRTGIYSLEDLITSVSPLNDDYTSKGNGLYNFVAYHAVNGTLFLDDLQNVNTNYGTYSTSPMNINGTGIDIVINRGAFNYDTIINGSDTTIINYVGIYYDQSNIITQSGALHFVDQIIQPFTPGRAIKTYQFYEEALIREYRELAGTYLIEDSASTDRLKWWGADLSYYLSGDEAEKAWNDDYLFIEGDFVITYRVPPLVQGKYTMFINADANGDENAVVEVYIDGEEIGGLIDLTSGGTSSNPYMKIELGNVDFNEFKEHTIKIESLIPGKFVWDYVRFEPL